ncbi:MAG: DUF447 domain-containing protein [Pseudomonadota bacterium]|nr:DUF447 domain-containing protein [Pseudomonadota bacterium]
MIREIIFSTSNKKGNFHMAPFGITIKGKDLIIAPFRPSRTLDNLLENPVGVMNYTDDAYLYAALVVGKGKYKVSPAKKIKGFVLKGTLAHSEVRVTRIKDDSTRPRLYLKKVYEKTHKPFQGFNRAQSAIIETSVLISRLGILPLGEISKQIAIHKSCVDKTAGPRELAAWKLLMNRFNQFIKKRKKK